MNAEKIHWPEALTLADWVRRALQEGQQEVVTKLMKNLPAANREKYRAIYREWKKKKNDRS